ncbi:MAG: tyrosine-type recombinase/integrase [Acidobacteriales bacterium]|nr:tyrosine-type recombinase/integrase [Terriglobales bacterium]
MQSETLTVAELSQQFLTFVKLDCAPATYRWYKLFLNCFCESHGHLLISDLTPGMVRQWIAGKYGNHSASTKHTAARAVKRLCNWGCDERLILSSPIRGFKKPPAGRRERYVTPTNYAACLRAVSQSQRAHLAGPIRDIIKFLWHTGCRPQELRVIEADWVRGRKIVMPREQSKGKIRARVIYLDSMAAGIVNRLSKQYPTGPIFRNTDGKLWKRHALTLTIRRIGERAGIKGLCPYMFRHGFVTRYLEKGTDVATLAALSGNSPRMILDVYSHVAANEDRLLDVLSA